MAAALPEGSTVRVVEARDWSPAHYDVIDARSGPDGSGFDVAIFHLAALYEFADSVADGSMTTHRGPGGRVWAGPGDAAIQGIYYASDSGIVLSVAHYSQRGGEQLNRDQLLEIASKIATSLDNDPRIDARATIATRPNPAERPVQDPA